MERDVSIALGLGLIVLVAWSLWRKSAAGSKNAGVSPAGGVFIPGGAGVFVPGGGDISTGGGATGSW